MAGYLHRGLKNILQKHPQDIVILSALRTPVTRAYKGGLKDAHDHELLHAVLRATLAKFSGTDLPAHLGDITIGAVLSELGGSKAGRMAALHAGLPTSAPFSTLNRACASGVSAITAVAHAIATGAIDAGIGGGMESMSRNYGSRAIPTALWGALRDSDVQDARDCIMSMGLTAENVAERYGVGRAECDAFAARSQGKAAHAQAERRFAAETVPVHTTWTDPKDTAEAPAARQVTVSADDGVRATTAEKLGGLKAAFKEGGVCTAGNSSQVSDGAGAAVLARRAAAERLGLAGMVVGKWAGTRVVGCRPDEMGVGPAAAVPALLDAAGIGVPDVGVWEVNEAFAAQALHCLRVLGIDEAKVNPNGGAIALGHPLGATGARMLATLLPEMGRQGAELGVVTMCIGTGMGSATLFVKE